MSDTDTLIIRSYRRVFNVDRRIYRAGDTRLPVRGGIPLWGAVGFLAILILVILAAQLPGTGWALGTLSPPLRFIVLPFGVAWLLLRVNADGRPLHVFAWSWVRLRVTNLRRRDQVKWDGKVKVRWDADSPVLRRGQVKGPATVEFRVPVTLNDRWNGWWAEGSAGEPRTVGVLPGRTLKARS